MKNLDERMKALKQKAELKKAVVKEELGNASSTAKKVDLLIEYLGLTK